MVEASGRGGQVQFDGSFVTISRRGMHARMIVGKGDKRIPISSITAVQWKPAGVIIEGFIQFTLMGGKELRSHVGNQTMAASRDENSVIFTQKQQSAFEVVRDAVESAIAERLASTVAPTVVAAQPMSAADELTKLAKLHADGVLSDEEFATAKAKALGL